MELRDLFLQHGPCWVQSKNTLFKPFYIKDVDHEFALVEYEDGRNQHVKLGLFNDYYPLDTFSHTNEETQNDG